MIEADTEPAEDSVGGADLIDLTVALRERFTNETPAEPAAGTPADAAD